MPDLMPETNNYKEIIQEIEGISQGLTGDPEKDVPYLISQGEKYAHHQYAQEILRACGRAIYDLMSEDEKKRVHQLGKDEAEGFNKALEDIRYQIYQKQYHKALGMVETMVEEQENAGLFQDDSVSEYHCFKEIMEEVLYVMHTEPKKDIRHAAFDYAEMYLLYGSLLIELKEPEKAEKVLEKALKWNPANAGIMFEYAESLKLQEKIEEFRVVTMTAFGYCIHPNDFARCYRNLGYYFVEKKEFETAVCCLLFSTNYGRNEMVQSELYYIGRITGKIFTPSEEDLEKCFYENQIPFAPEKEALSLACAYSREAYARKELVAAEYFFEIIRQFLGDEETGKFIEYIRAGLE